MEINKKYIHEIIKEQEESRAKDIAHLFQRDGISYEDFKNEIIKNKESYEYICSELKRL